MTDYDIVALKVAMGTATMQTKIERLNDDSELRMLKRKITEHAGRCFDEAVEKARTEWETLNRLGASNGRLVTSRLSPSTQPTGSPGNSGARRRMRSVK